MNPTDEYNAHNVRLRAYEEERYVKLLRDMNKPEPVNFCYEPEESEEGEVSAVRVIFGFASLAALPSLGCAGIPHLCRRLFTS
jgi:hypothetical protein